MKEAGDGGRKFNQDTSGPHSPKENLLVVKITEVKKVAPTATRGTRHVIQNQRGTL